MKRLLLIVGLALLFTQSAFATAPFKNSCVGTTNTFANSVACTITGTPVAAGDLVVVWAGWAVGGVTPAVSDGTTSFTAGSLNTASNWASAYGQYFYLTASVATGNLTYTLTATGSYGPDILVLVFTPSGAATFDADIATESGNASTAVDSHSITTTGSDELIVGGAMIENGPTVSAQAIGGVSATTNSLSGYSGGFTHSGWFLAATGSVAATATLSSSQKWLSNEIGFKIASGATAPRQLTTTGAGD